MFVQGIVRVRYSLSLFLYYELLVCYTVLVTALLESISNAVIVTALLESISHLCLLTLFTDSNLQTQWTIKIKFTPIRSPLKSTQMHFKTTQFGEGTKKL